MRFFFDNCVSPRLARALQAFYEGTHEIVHLKDKFHDPSRPDESLEDEEWLAKLSEESRADSAERAWIVITEDHAILSRTARGGGVRAAWERAGLRTFFLPKGARKAPLQQIQILLRQWDKILRHAEGMDPTRPVQIPERGETFRDMRH